MVRPPHGDVENAGGGDGMTDAGRAGIELG